MDESLRSWMAVALVAILTWGVWVRLMKSKKGFKLPPGPRAWPLVGCLPFLPKLYPRELMLTSLAAKYGDLMLLRMGQRNVVVVSSARMAEEILQTHDHEFANRPNAIAAKYIGFHDTGLSSMSSGSPLFKPTRRMFAAKIVSPSNVAATRHIRKEQVLKLLCAAVHDSDAGLHVNVSKAVSVMAMNLALCMSFGQAYDADDAETLVRAFEKIMMLLQKRNVGDSIPALRHFDVQGIEAGLKEVEVELRQSITTLLEKKKREMKALSMEEIRSASIDGGITTKLLSMEGEDRFSEEHIMSVVFTLLLAGTSSISLVITEALHEVVTNPSIYSQAVAELDTVVGCTRLVEESDIPNLPTIRNIIKETLRLHAPTPTLLPRRNFTPCEVGGYHIPADCVVLVNLYSIMRDPEFWDCPEEFCPERWNHLQDLKVQGSDFHYMPFGFGKRQCPAVNLGTISVQYVLAVCLQCVSWETPGGVVRRMNLSSAREPRKKDDLVLDGTLRVEPRLLQVDAEWEGPSS